MIASLGLGLLRPNLVHRFPQQFGWLRAKKAASYPAFFINNGKKRMPSSAVALLQPDNGRIVSFQANHSHRAYKFIRQPIHDRLHLQSGRSPVGVEHDQSRPLDGNSRFIRGRPATADQRRS